MRQSTLGSALVLLVCSGALPACDNAQPVLEDEQRAEVHDLDADQICADIEACCGVDVLNCENSVVNAADWLARQVEWAEDAGLALTRDEACPLLPYAVGVASECSGASSCAPPCNAWVGSVPEGGECETVGDLSNCAQGLSCFAVTSGSEPHVGTCANPCNTVGLACNDYEAMWGNDYILGTSHACGPAGYCDAELGDWGTCAAVRQLGDACPENRGCANGLYCDETQVCAPQRGPGELCDQSQQCIDGHLCDDATGRCYEEWVAPAPDAPLGCSWAV